MSLPQSYSLSPKNKSGSTKRSSLGSSESEPNIRKLITRLSAGGSITPAEQDNLVSRLTRYPPLVSMTNPHRASSTISVGYQTRYENPEPIQICGFDTKLATLSILSFDQSLSSERIVEMLTTIGTIHWIFLNDPHQTWSGYLGLYFPGNIAVDLTTDRPHTQISVTWPKHTKVNLLTRLRMLARAGCEQLPFWAELTGAIAAADQAFSEGHVQGIDGKATSIPAIFASINSKPGAHHIKEPSFEAIGALAQHMALPWLHRKPADRIDEIDTCGKAFLWQEFGKALWIPECLRRATLLLGAPGERWEASEFVSNIADHWINLVSFDQIQIEVSGVKLKYNIANRGILMGLWRQAVELECSKIPPHALKYLHSRLIYSPDITPYSVASSYDAAYGDALSQKLIAEAQQRNAFVPVGGFRTLLPPSMPISGVEELCIWSDGQGIWFSPIPAGVIFYWKPGGSNPLSTQVGNDATRSAWHLILAALWHDLVTEGHTVLVRTSNDKPVFSTNLAEGKTKRRRSHSRPDTHVLRLPSQRVIHMDGIHTWGTPEEIEKIKRQAHQVRGHRRKLLPGHQRSLYALENARRFNFIMPDGYTFVKPYQTGLNDMDAPATKETPILARGLASLMLMSKDYSKRSAAS